MVDRQTVTRAKDQGGTFQKDSSGGRAEMPPIFSSGANTISFKERNCCREHAISMEITIRISNSDVLTHVLRLFAKTSIMRNESGKHRQDAK